MENVLEKRSVKSMVFECMLKIFYRNKVVHHQNKPINQYSKGQF